MWHWDNATIPVRNYIGWFLSSLVLFSILDLAIKDIKNKIAPALFIIQFVFFVILNILFRIF